MTNWLVGTTPNNFGIAKKRGFDIECFHDLYKNQVERVEQGDGLVYYIGDSCQLGAILEAISTSFNGETRIFEGLPNNPNEIYPHRFKTRPILVPANNELLNAEKVHSRLSFITTKQKAYSWKLAFRPSLKEIPHNDFEYIKSDMKKSGFYKEVKQGD